MALTIFTALLVLCSVLQTFAVSKTSSQVKKLDPNDNRGNTPFFLQDPTDQMCLGPNGFTICDESALWILTKRTGLKTYSLVSFTNPAGQGSCLQRKTGFLGLFGSDKVTVGSCAKGNAKSWLFEFVDHAHVKLSNKGLCLVRGKKNYKNSISVQNCNKGEFVPLVYHSTAVHEHGFLLKAADGTCFDGSKFRSCSGMGSGLLLWGQGAKFVGNRDVKRYFFTMSGDRSTCLVSKGKEVSKGSCGESSALGWELFNGQLYRGNQCLARLADDTAVLASCHEGREFLTMEIPSQDDSSSSSRARVRG